MFFLQIFSFYSLCDTYTLKVLSCYNRRSWL